MYLGARWSLYAERMMPLVKRAEEVLALPVDGDRKQRGAVGMAKLHARDALDILRPLLFPEDD